MSRNLQRQASNAGSRLDSELARNLLFVFRPSLLAWGLILYSAPLLLAQSDPASTNAIPKLSPPYDELPPAFWEVHGAEIWGLVSVLCLLAALAVWLVFRHPPAVNLPPEVRAREALEGLRRRPEDGTLLSGVSRIVRGYFIAAFQLPSGEPTTAEFSRALRGSESVGSDLAAAVSDFLQRCDEQKFSPSKPPLPLGAVEQALSLVGQAERRRAQSATPQPTGA